MGKSEIVKQLAERVFGNANEVNIKKCNDFCDALVDIFIDALLEDKKILWKGFLKVEVVKRAARKGKNPQTNKVVTFPPVNSIVCKFSKSIKDLVNNK
jgi:nucleoid DNA-binding protein